MFGIDSLLFADAASPASAATTTKYQFSQWQSFSEWWQTPLVVLACLAVVAFVAYMYRRDSVELRPGIGLFLAIMRLAAFAGLLLFYLDLQKWSEQKEIQNSRVLVLADTSISMGLGNSDAPSSSPGDSRIGQVVTEFTAGRMLDDMRKTHDVVVWRFDQDLGRIATLPKVQDVSAGQLLDITAQAARESRAKWLRNAIIAAAGVFAFSILGSVVRRLLRGRRTGSWVFGIGATLSAMAIFGALAYLSLDNPNADLLVLLGIREPPAEPFRPQPTDQSPSAPSQPAKVDWAAAIKPRGIETRLGECLRELISEERTQPVSGVVVFTDGGQNAGLDPSAAVELARETKIPVYLVGLGSDRRPVSARIADFAAPPRAYPGDSFTVTAEIEAQGMAGRQVDVELASRPAGKVKAANPPNWNREDEQTVSLPGDGKKERVKFELSGIKEAGRRTLQLRIKLPASQTNSQQQAGDLVREADVEIVDRKNRVLLLAGGPTREYQFLRNQLRRDRDTIVDVLLQTANGPVSQDANAILDHFPGTMQELSEYDAIVAFDPDWKNLDSDPVARDEKIGLLEKWVAEEAGGLVLIAGPVYTDDWAQDREMSKIRNLYPVEFNRLLIQAKDAKYGSETPGSIEFTREGQEVEFLWLGSSAAESLHNWADFKGVFGYYRVKGKKPGATVYARYGDSDSSAAGEELPIYMAGQLYGAGRVFYLGSGEMWRIRALDETFFEQFYTKLLRHVSQGRLLRGSRRGNLSVERDTYLLGSTVDIDARLTNVQHQPLDLPKIVAEVTPQNGTPLMVPLLADPNRKGTYHGQFSALEVGPQRIELPIPESQEEPLSRQIIVKVPDLEKDNPQRNDALLNEIASGTGGRYYIGVSAALGDNGKLPPLVGQLKDRSRETPKSGDIDKDWERLWMTWLLCGICGFLCLEWLVRRLSRLA
jgi:von Willebrand factor type A domain